MKIVLTCNFSLLALIDRSHPSFPLTATMLSMVLCFGALGTARLLNTEFEGLSGTKTNNMVNFFLSCMQIYGRLICCCCFRSDPMYSELWSSQDRAIYAVLGPWCTGGLDDLGVSSAKYLEI